MCNHIFSFKQHLLHSDIQPAATSITFAYIELHTPFNPWEELVTYTELTNAL